MNTNARTGQTRIRFTAADDPRYCASAFCRARRLTAPTHEIALGKRKFRLCARCARPWESIRGATVSKIGGPA